MLPSMPAIIFIGRPNVGKSTLFNRLIRSNRAITHDRPGITRDRMEGTVRDRGMPPFRIVDTGGLTLDAHAAVTEGPEGIRGFEADILRQAEAAVADACAVAFVVDGRDGLLPLDEHLASHIRRKGLPTLCVVNKVDGAEHEDELTAEFHCLGFPILAVSAEHGHNLRALREELVDLLPLAYRENPPTEIPITSRGKRHTVPTAAARAKKAQADDAEAAKVAEANAFAKAKVAEANAFAKAKAAEAAMDDAFAEFADSDDATEMLTPNSFSDPAEAGIDTPEALAGTAVTTADAAESTAPLVLRLAMLGRPNAGKSSLINALAGEERMIVSEVAGTTRDSVDVRIQQNGRDYVFVDTAGVRRRTKITDSVEKYSVNAAIKSSTKAHVTLLTLDATEGVSQQDKRLMDMLDTRKTAFMVLINKCDLVPRESLDRLRKNVSEILAFCAHVPILLISAHSGKDLKKILPLAAKIQQECGVRISTGKLNRAMEDVLTKHQPPVVKRVRAKFFYLTQAETEPPTFVFFVSDADRVPESYTRYLERALRRIFAISHAPMRVHMRSSHKKKDGRRS